MTYVGRDGRENFASFRWRRPVVVLVDQGTRSGKEVVTYGLKRHGVRVVGTRTAGALLAARGFLLRDGSLLVLAVSDVRVEGERITDVVRPGIEGGHPQTAQGGSESTQDQCPAGPAMPAPPAQAGDELEGTEQ